MYSPAHRLPLTWLERFPCVTKWTAIHSPWRTFISNRRQISALIAIVTARVDEFLAQEEEGSAAARKLAAFRAELQGKAA